MRVDRRALPSRNNLKILKNSHFFVMFLKLMISVVFSKQINQNFKMIASYIKKEMRRNGRSSYIYDKHTQWVKLYFTYKFIRS